MSDISLVDIASRYWQSMALNAAVQLELFPALAAEPMSSPQLASALACSERHLDALACSLAGLGLLKQENGIFDLADAQRSLLDPASPDCMLGALKFNADLAGLWMKLPECVKEGTPAIPGNPHLGEDPARTRRFVEGMHSRAGLMARALLPMLHPEPDSKVLDVGGGPGTFSLKLAERDPSLNITVLDLPPVVKAAAEIHEGKKALDSITFQGGDYHTADYPGNQDWILYSGALHQEPESGVLALFQKMKAALKPGGSLVVVDLMLDEDRTTPVYSALFEINMMLMRPHSRVYTSGRLLNVLAETGFRDPVVRDVPDTPYRLVEAQG